MKWPKITIKINIIYEILKIIKKCFEKSKILFSLNLFIELSNECVNY